MLDHLKSLLTSSDPATLLGSVAVAVFAIVYCWRRFLPRSWNWLEMRIPLVDRIDNNTVWTFAWKLAQALPATLFGALIPALLTGGDVKKTLLGALAGPVAAIGHEVLKLYKGQTGKPGSRSIPPAAALALAFVVALSVTACGWFRGSFWPAVAHCAPTTTEIATAVEAILIAGGDYEASLRDLTKQFTKDAVECTVKALVDKWGKPGISAREGMRVSAAYGRGKAFLAEVEQ